MCIAECHYCHCIVIKFLYKYSFSLFCYCCLEVHTYYIIIVYIKIYIIYLLDIYKRFGKSVEFKKYVMLEVDFYLSLGWVRMV